MDDLEILRKEWAEYWGVEPHSGIGRSMLEKSLQFKIQERNSGGLSEEHLARLNGFIKQYKRNRNCFDDGKRQLKPGTRLVKTWKEKRYSVLVTSKGFEYDDKIYTSLSEVAYAITGTRWNGWRFFGLYKS